MIQNQWYVGCASSQLKTELVAGNLLDKPIVLFRDTEGKPQALLDRCCHRGFPLSKSKIKNGRIECGFHGWQYDGSGRVLRIPSQTEDKVIPKIFCVPSFRCEEKDGYVWVWAGDGQPSPVPEMPEIHSGHWMQGTCEIACNYLRALEITFDAPHVYFLHPSHPATIAAAKYGFKESQTELRATEHGCILFAPPTAFETDPIPTQGMTMEFRLPGHIRFTINGAPYMNFFTMPLSESRCRMDWTIVNWGADLNLSEKLLWTGHGGPIISEDQFALENAQKAYDREGEDFERSVETDIPTLMLRRIVKAAEAGLFGKKDLGPKRRLVNAVNAAKFE